MLSVCRGMEIKTALANAILNKGILETAKRGATLDCSRQRLFRFPVLQRIHEILHDAVLMDIPLGRKTEKTTGVLVNHLRRFGIVDTGHQFVRYRNLFHGFQIKKVRNIN